MQKTIEKAVHFCDSCGKEMDYVSYKCFICKKELCYECGQKQLTRFSPGVYFSGSRDGDFCNDCLSKPTPLEWSALLAGYRLIRDLQVENERFYGDFKRRTELAEKNLENLYNEAKVNEKVNRR